MNAAYLSGTNQRNIDSSRQFVYYRGIGKKISKGGKGISLCRILQLERTINNLDSQWFANYVVKELNELYDL